jgi:Pyruvate/2-oxoacid:ferredoxin oxidoreductase gamma subunit
MEAKMPCEVKLMKDINVIVAGAAGEGVQTIGDLLTNLA